MTQNASPDSSNRPLSVGNVVNAALVLYRSNLKSYLGIALTATLWSIPGVLLFIIFFSLLFSLLLPPAFRTQGTDPWATIPTGVKLIIVAVGLLPVLYCYAKSLTNSALISRLAFKELTNQPERVRDARRQIMPRFWSFLRVAVQVGLSLFLVYLGLAIGLMLAIVVIGLVLGVAFGAVLGGNRTVLIGLVLGLSYVIAFIGIIGGILWFYSRWIIAEVPLAVEETISGAESVEKSWFLTKNSVMRILLIVLVAFVVTIPLIALTSYVPQIFLIRIKPGSSFFWIIYLVSLGTSLAGGVLVMPFWQAIKAVLYYDLRNRREGMDLQLRDRGEPQV